MWAPPISYTSAYGRCSTGRGSCSPPKACHLWGLRHVYGQAVISNVFNPKIAIFFLAYLPQFADRSAGISVTLQLLGLGLAFAFITWVIFSIIACFSGALGGWLRRRPRIANGLSWLTGGVLIGLGLRLAWPERR